MGSLMDSPLTIAIVIAILLVIGLVAAFIYSQKKFRGQNLPAAAREKGDFIHLKCPRCNHLNYVEETSYIKLCNSCGWNLTEPYIYTNCILNLNEEMNWEEISADLKENDRVFLKRDIFVEEDIEKIAVLNQDYEKIGWIPDDISKKLIEDIEMSSKIFSIIKKIQPSKHIEILITNDAQKLYSEST
ncbi:MAG: hypothetical protein FWJ66_06805 [Caldibacillus sp.]